MPKLFRFRLLPVVSVVSLSTYATSPLLADASSGRTELTPQVKVEAPAPAPDSTEPSSLQTAEAHFRLGSNSFKEKKYAEAISHFTQANQLRPSPELLFNIGLAHDKLGNVPLALRYYREYQHELGTVRSDERVRNRISELEAQLSEQGVQQVTLRSTPPGATLLIDGREVGTTPWTGELTPGSHDAELRLSGYESSQLRFTLSVRASLDLAGTLRQSEAAPAQEPAPIKAALGSQSVSPENDHLLEMAERPSSQFGAWPWVSIGLSVASGITAGTFELARRSAEQDARDAETLSRFSDSLSRAEAHQTTARVAAGASVGFLTVGILLLVLDSSTESDDTAALSCASIDCRFSFRF